MIQGTIFLVTIVLMAVVVGVFVFIAINAGKESVDYGPVQAKAFGIRTGLFWVVVVAGVLITVITTLDLPYAATRGDVAEGAVKIQVEGRQWLWTLSQDSVTVDDTVVFEVTAGDVNHGLGVYDPNMRLLGQTQAMPGYVNSLQITLREPGMYKLLCLEYCGTAHHAMMSNFEVAAHPERAAATNANDGRDGT